MRNNYKQLGAYIQQVNQRNKNLISEDLRGLSMTKEFRKSTSNIVGTDLSKYKLVYKHQFACDFMSVIRVHKLPVVLHSENFPIIVSPAYTVFEIIDKNELNPEYLMMWFRRSEFDRYADFRCDSAIRGGFKWNELCEVELPIPSIEKQREIVAEYNAVDKRIRINEQLNQKLEETAQAIYKHWFVDFEFPYVTSSGVEMPYKSSGGKLVYNEELDKEIPEGWEVKSLSAFCNITSSKRIFKKEYTKTGIPFYRAGEIRLKKEGKPIKDSLFISEKRYKEVSDNYGQPEKGDILMTAVGSLLGDSYLVEKEEFYFKDGNVIWLKDFNITYSNLYIFTYLQSDMFRDYLDEIRIGSGQSAITIKGLGEKKFAIPSPRQLKDFQILSSLIYKKQTLNNTQNAIFYRINNLFLSKMSKVEVEKEMV